MQYPLRYLVRILNRERIITYVFLVARFAVTGAIFKQHPTRDVENNYRGSLFLLRGSGALLYSSSNVHDAQSGLDLYLRRVG